MSDDLRESPNVELAETLVGKGYEVRIHDPVVKPSQLIGTNRQYVESRLPHLQRFLSDTALRRCRACRAGGRVLLRPRRHRGAREQPAAADHRSDRPAGSKRRGARGIRGRRVVEEARRSEHVLIIVQNLPVPFDRRVWLECQALRSAAGYEVSVVCPKAPGDPDLQVIDGVEIYKYRPYHRAGAGKFGFLFEYVYSFCATAWSWPRCGGVRGSHVLQACNPPDIFWPLGLLFGAIGRSRFVFDHHDLCPELYESRFPDGPRARLLGAACLECCTFASADHVISTNESYRQMHSNVAQSDPRT